MAKTNKDKDEIKRLKEHIKSMENKVRAAIVPISLASGIKCVDKALDILRSISKEMDEWTRS